MQTYTIHDRTEETDCSYCGMPLYVGDKAVDNDIDVFCSKSCAVIKQSRVTVLTTDEERHAIRYQNAPQEDFFNKTCETHNTLYEKCLIQHLRVSPEKAIAMLQSVLVAGEHIRRAIQLNIT